MTRNEVLKWLKDNISFNPEETFSSGIPFRLRKHPEIIQEIEKIINFKSNREAELLYRLVNLDEKGVCELCGKPTQFISYRDGYKKACCKECAAKLTVLKGKQTKEKIYGSSGYNNPEKNKETKIKNHGTASYNNLGELL